jgi:hypothetical protein
VQRPIGFGELGSFAMIFKAVRQKNVILFDRTDRVNGYDFGVSGFNAGRLSQGCHVVTPAGGSQRLKFDLAIECGRRQDGTKGLCAKQRVKCQQPCSARWS